MLRMFTRRVAVLPTWSVHGRQAVDAAGVAR